MYRDTLQNVLTPSQNVPNLAIADSPVTLSQFSLDDTEVITATVDLEDVRASRDQKSRAMQALCQPKYDRIEVSFSLSREGDEIDLSLRPTPPRAVEYLVPQHEIASGPACYLWDFLRRSKQAGFFVGNGAAHDFLF